MEELDPIRESEQASFCVELMKRLNMQREQDYLCDITLVAKDGEELKAHRNVLSAASPFFVKLLQSDMKENREGVARFEEISSPIMEDVLEFVYTGSVEINDEQNAKDLIIAADYLLLECLKTFSGRFLEQRLTSSNCISTLHFAEKYKCAELVSNSRKFVHDNFAFVAESDEFLNLEAKEVGSWISSDEISVAAEEDIFKIIEKWIERNKSDRKANFEELFRHVRLVLVSRDFLLDVVTNELVRDRHCLQKVLAAIELINCASEDTLLQSPRRRLRTHAIVARGGKYTFCYLPEQDKWKRLPDGLSESRYHPSQMITFRDQLYAFTGGSNTEKYDPVFDGWASLRGFTLSCRKLAAVVRGQIYAIDRSARKTTIERFDVGLRSWETVLLSDKGCRDDSCVVAAGNCLYVLGGEHPQQYGQYVAKAERFDTVQNKWEEIADMQQERGYAFGVATPGKIFVAGGRGHGSRELKTCEVYSISTSEWQFIGSLNIARSCGSMVCVNGTLYVLGGSRSEHTVESYNIIMNEWTQKTTIPVNEIPDKENPSFKGCALKLSKAVLDKLN